MKSCIVPPNRATLNVTSLMLKVLPILLGILLSARVARAQQTADPADQDKQTIRVLLQRVEQLEARVTQLEAARQGVPAPAPTQRSEEHTSELQSLRHLVCRLLLEKKKKKNYNN